MSAMFLVFISFFCVVILSLTTAFISAKLSPFYPEKTDGSVPQSKKQKHHHGHDQNDERQPPPARQHPASENRKAPPSSTHKHSLHQKDEKNRGKGERENSKRRTVGGKDPSVLTLDDSGLHDVPWSWSGSSWSMSSMSSESDVPSSSSSSSSSSSGSINPFLTTTTTTGAPTPAPSASSSSSSSSSSGGSSSSSSSSSAEHPNHHKFIVYNNCTNAIWVAILGNPGYPTIAHGGFVMARAGPHKVIWIPRGWQGRLWARVDCKFNASGTCNPPYQPCCLSGSCLQADGTFGIHCAHSGLAPTSLVEFSLDNDSPLGPYDDYDTSLVDGWSVPLSIQPIPGTYNPTPNPGKRTTKWCGMSGCLAAPDCPEQLNVHGSLVSCYSPCQAAVNNKTRYSKHDLDRSCCVCTQSHPKCNCKSSTTYGSWYYGCCVGGFGCSPNANPSYPSDQTCDPWSRTPGRGWHSYELDYIKNVKSACKSTYTWEFDDSAGNFQCSPRNAHSMIDYAVTFVTRFRDDAPTKKRLRAKLPASEAEVQELH